ncbi:MAG: manganese catalase family protein [Christensenellaceae bacterium]|nr:manganese catalase family protein [Christensenellaceae bacterium]
MYEKRLIYPLKNIRPNARMAKLIAFLLGGPNGEFSASTTYLNQRYCMPLPAVQATLTDVGTEELSHVEMLSTMMKQMLSGISIEQLRAAGMEGWAAEFGCCPFPANWNRESWTSAYVGTTGDPIANMINNMAAEEKARAGYEGVIRQCDDPDIIAPLQFLREREIVHFQRFGEALQMLYDHKDAKKCF